MITGELGKGPTDLVLVAAALAFAAARGRGEPGQEAEFSITYIDQTGRAPQALTIATDQSVAVQVGEWRQLTSDSLGTGLASRYIAVGSARLNAAIDEVVHVKFSMGETDALVCELVVRTPQLVSRAVEQYRARPRSKIELPAPTSDSR